MAVAAVTTKPLKKKRLPDGQPREWYESHNRSLKACAWPSRCWTRVSTAPSRLVTGGYAPPPPGSGATRRPTPRADGCVPSSATPTESGDRRPAPPVVT